MPTTVIQLMVSAITPTVALPVLAKEDTTEMVHLVQVNAKCVLYSHN